MKEYTLETDNGYMKKAEQTEHMVIASSFRTHEEKTVIRCKLINTPGFDGATLVSPHTASADDDPSAL